MNSTQAPGESEDGPARKEPGPAGSSPVVRLGELELIVVSGGVFRIDGGTMFGVVPKLLWDRKIPSDDQNRIPQQTNCLIVRSSRGCTLIDTGIGGHLSEREQRNYGLSTPGHPLLRNLAAAGIAPEEITTVILTHLHFDHAGGGVVLDQEGVLQPTFPNAEYVVQRGEWMQATAGFPELRAAYPQQNLLPVQESGQLRLIDQETEILPGLHSRVTGGHTQFHMAVVIESQQQRALYAADVCPTEHHLPQLWCMAYDVDPLQTRRIKQQLLGEAVDSDSLVLFDHDPGCAAARIERDNRGGFTATDRIPAPGLD